MADVKDLVGISVFYGDINEGWDKSSIVHCTPTDWIKVFTLPIVD